MHPFLSFPPVEPFITVKRHYFPFRKHATLEMTIRMAQNVTDQVGRNIFNFLLSFSRNNNHPLPSLYLENTSTRRAETLFPSHDLLVSTLISAHMYNISTSSYLYTLSSSKRSFSSTSHLSIKQPDGHRKDQPPCFSFITI
jgi:hypothetical protein